MKDERKEPEKMIEEPDCEICYDGTFDIWECPSCCRKIVESRPDSRQDWNEFIKFAQDHYWDTLEKHKDIVMIHLKALIQHFSPPAKVEMKWPKEYDIAFMKHGPVVSNTWYAEGWNACLAEFKRLNPGVEAEKK